MRLMLRKFLMLVIAVLALGFLAACGNKGPLFIPNTELPTVSMTPTTPPATVTTPEESEK